MVEINNTFPPIIKEIYLLIKMKKGGGCKYNGHIIGQQAIEK